MQVAKSMYSIKQFWQTTILFLVVIGALKISPLAILGVAGLLLLSLVGNRVEYVFSSILMLLALSVMNQVLVQKDFIFYLVTRGSIFAIAGVVTMRSGATRNAWFLSPFYFLVGYVIYMMFTSLQGWAPLISELKAVLFLVFIIAFISLVSAVNLKMMDVKYLRTCMLVVAAFYILGSIAVIPFPGIGQSMILARQDLLASEFVASEKSLFNGLTWHSQTLGPLLAMLNAFLLSDYLCAIRAKSWLYRIMLLGIPLLVYKTSSRTALFAYIISILATLFFYQREKQVIFSERQKVLGGFALFIAIGFIMLAIMPSTRNSVEGFLRKTSTEEGVDRSVSMTESLTQTRMGLVEEGLANFKENPLLGNGFQVSKDMQGMSQDEKGLILSAPVEKGIMPVMVLEEGGVIGAAIMIMFVCLTYKTYLRLGLHCFLSCFTTMLALNTGEAVFFSTSGAGGILWAICFTGLAIDVGRKRRELAANSQARFNGAFQSNFY